MVADNNAHSAAVDAWLSATVNDLPPERQVQLFEGAFLAMWSRAHVTLGEVTLTAIVDRVLNDAAAQHPLVSLLEVEPTGIGFERLREGARDQSDGTIDAAIRTVLVEFLRVLGSLTAEILTPALHAALATVEPAPRAGAERTQGEDTT